MSNVLAGHRAPASRRFTTLSRDTAPIGIGATINPTTTTGSVQARSHTGTFIATDVETGVLIGGRISVLDTTDAITVAGPMATMFCTDNSAAYSAK